MKATTVLLSSILLLSAADANTQPASDARPLQPGVPVERELAPGPPHTYRLTLTQSQYVHVVIDQRGIDVTTTVLDPSGRTVSTFDSSNTEGPEPVWVVADESGDFRFVVGAARSRASLGRYEIRVADLHVATAQDRQRVSTQKLLVEAEALTTKGTAESLREAIPKYEAALDAWRAVNETVSAQDILARANANLDEARGHIEAAIERIESLRTAVARQELRSSYLASKTDRVRVLRRSADADAPARSTPRLPSGRARGRGSRTRAEPARHACRGPG